MRLKKISIMIWAALSVSLLCISFAAISFSSEAGQLIFTDTADPKAEKLFRKMGIVEIPHIKPPEDFSLMDINGQRVTLSDFKGKIVFLNFWTTWCPECRIEMPSLEKLHRKLNGKDFAMIAVNLQEPLIRVKDFLKKYPLTFTILLDKNGKIGRQFGIRAIPATYILDKNGGIIGKAFGSRHWDRNASIALFEHLINRVVKHTKTNTYDQKKSISSHSVQSDTNIGNSADDPADTARTPNPYDFS